jgi:hypothetical protein
VWVCGEIAAGPKLAMLEQALQRVELSIGRIFSSVNPNVGVFSAHNIN